MKPHLTSSMTTRTAQAQDGAPEAVAHVADVAHAAGVAHAPVVAHSTVVARSAAIGRRGASRTKSPRGRAHLTLASAPVWRHKLILTGMLNYRTAVELEDEIECLCEEGVTTLILDLRQLDVIDSAGARTIAYRGAVCKKRGRDFTVIPGSPTIHRALAEAGAGRLAANDSDDPGNAVETGVLRLSTGYSDNSPRDMSTAMIKNL
jgi:anti-anti-sigma factor